jgi:hypothetical protein
MWKSVLDRDQEAASRELKWIPTLRVLAFLFLSNTVSATGLAQVDKNGAKEAANRPEASGYVGNQACARCHASIYDSYTRTPMAHASGPAAENLISADFVHTNSAVHYRIYTEGSAVWLSFERRGDPAAYGKCQLLYSIGSGGRGTRQPRSQAVGRRI